MDLNHLSSGVCSSIILPYCVYILTILPSVTILPNVYLYFNNILPGSNILPGVNNILPGVNNILPGMYTLVKYYCLEIMFKIYLSAREV